MIFWVLLPLLVVVEEELYWCSCVAILSRQDDLHSEIEDVLAYLLTLVVSCVIEQPVCVLSPVTLLICQYSG